MFFARGWENQVSDISCTWGRSTASCLASVSSRNRLDFKSHPSVALAQYSWYITAGIVHQMTTSKTNVVEPAQRKKINQWIEDDALQVIFFFFHPAL